jgi:HD-GYP domain-containing protein (c-di-GMP phosphodiesterase class II)
MSIMVLKAKFITIIMLVLLLVVGGSTVVVLRLQETRINEHALHESSVINMLFVQSINDAMTRGLTEDVEKIMMNISENPEIVSLRILSQDGEILKSKDPAEIGRLSERYLSNCNRIAGAASIMHNDRIMSYRVIKNGTACHGCHDSSRTVNGIIEMGIDIKRQKKDIAAVRRFLIFSASFTTLIIALILSVLFSKNVISPLRELLNTIKDVEKGDWDSRVSIKSNDEIGVIGNAFNKMLGEVQSLYDKNIKKERELSRIRSELDNNRKLENLNRQLISKVKELESANSSVITLSNEVRTKNRELGKMVDHLKMINDVGRVLSSIIEKDEIIKLIIKTSVEVLNAKKGMIHIDSGERSSLTLHYKKGAGIVKLNELSFDFKETYANVLKDGTPYVITRGHPFNVDTNDSRKAIGVPLRMKGEIVGAMLLEEKVDGEPFTNDEIELMSTLSRHAMVAIENAWLYDKLKNNYLATIQSLVNALEASDPYTKGHSERVRFISVKLAEYIGLEQREIDALEHAAILHDIGKIGLDTGLLNKEEALSKDEMRIIKARPTIGDEILGPIDTLNGVRTTVLQHHERYDGMGYPLGLVGEEITLKARVLAVADAFDAMLTDRPYREAYSLEKTLDEIQKKAGSQFDPYVVKSFIDLMNEKGREILKESGYNLEFSSVN